MSFKNKFRKKIRIAGKTIRFCFTCTSWGEYDVDDFRFSLPDENEDLQDSQQSELFDVSHSIRTGCPWFTPQGRTRQPVSDFEEALWEEDFAADVPVRPGVSCPVLNVCLGFQDHELKASKRLFYYSYTYKQSNWDRTLLQSEFAAIASHSYPEDPIIDGLPATVWLQCVEPTLCIMMSLCRLKHRKSNITSPKRYPEYPDSSHSRHGDYEFGPVAIFAGPRRASLRVDFVVQHIQDDAAAIIQMSFRNDRLRNRRRRLAGNQRSLLDDGIDLEEGNTNSSANAAPPNRTSYTEDYDGNTNQSAIRYPADCYKLTPVLYVWNSESRTSDVETAPANRYEMMSSIHFSYKMFSNARPNTEEYSQYGRNVCELASVDPVVRRYLLHCYNDPLSKSDTWFDRVYTEHYLRTEKEQEPSIELAQASPSQEHVSFYRRVSRNIRRGFHSFHHLYCIRGYFMQRQMIRELRHRLSRRRRPHSRRGRRRRGSSRQNQSDEQGNEYLRDDGEIWD